MNNQLGKTIRILRQAKSLTMTDAAKRSGVSVPYLSLVESGERQPSLDVMRRISETLGVPSEALVVMGMGAESLKPSDKRSEALTDSVDQLIQIEDKLAKLLGRESRSGAKPDPAQTSRRGHGAKR